jgi:Fe2+ transport system protein FeoA
MNQKLIVRSFHETEVRDFSEVESRLMLLGFLSGETIRVTKKAPLFEEPLLVEVRGRKIALSKDEAQIIKVEVKL